MLDGPATFAVAAAPAALAAVSSAVRSRASSGRANAGHRVATSTWVGCVPGQAASTSAAADRSNSRAALSSKAGMSRTSTLNVHKSGTVEYPSPPLIAVTVSLAGSGNSGPDGPGNGMSCSREMSAAALAIADGAVLLAPECTGVLVDVEQQHDAARPLAGRLLEPGGDVREDRRAGLGVR